MSLQKWGRRKQALWRDEEGAGPGPDCVLAWGGEDPLEWLAAPQGGMQVRRMCESQRPGWLWT